MTTGETVSVTIRLVTVAPPVLVTLTRYLTGSPIAPVVRTDLVTAIVRVGAGIVKSVSFVIIVVPLHAANPVTNAVLLTTVLTHTRPTFPDTVNVMDWPGRKLRPDALQA